MRYDFHIGADEAIVIQLADGETLDADGNADAGTTYITAATVTARLYTDDDVAVFAAVTLSYVADPDLPGKFRGLVSDTAIVAANFPPGNGYYLQIVASTPSSANRTWKLPARVLDS